MECDNSNDYVFNILKEVEIKQNSKSNTCEQKLGSNRYIYNTIPVMFICNDNCNWYIASSVFKDPISNSYKCFETPVFRIEKVDQDNTFIVELLQPQTSNGDISPISCKNEICNFFSLGTIIKFIRTNIYIKLNINCFCDVKCFCPVCAKHGVIKETIYNPCSVNVETSEYIAISDGIKKVYLNSDGIEGFNIIPNPHNISYANLFVNGILQPPSFYNFTEGKLTLDTEDVPIQNTYIILQLIKFVK